MKVIQKSGAWLWALLAALLLTVLLTATAFAGDNDFRCWTVDARQWTNQGYQSEKDGVWYLFLPQDESPADTVLSFSGRVTAASAGALDREGGTLTGAFADRDRVTLTLEGGRTETVCLRQSSLPSLRLILNGTTLDQIHQDKDVKYPGNDLVLTDGDDVLTGAVEIKGRGNSTWREYAKKPYQIKFSKKTSVLGMPAAKKWILLANASDDSMIRTRLVYDAAEQMDFPFVTEYQYVDLWIDGQYLGVYLLGEKAEIGKGRLNLQDPAGAMFELDNGFATDEDHYFFEGRLNSYFALKEIVEEDDEHIQQAMTNFQTAMTRLTTALTSQGWENLSLSQLNEMIDVDSLARYYLMNEYVLNGESFFTSFFWYQDGASDVLHVGPLWDFDTCMGNKNEKVTDYNASSTSVLMKKMLNIPAFYQRVQELYARYKPLLTGMAGQVDGLRDEIGVSADLNYLRWSTLGTANPKPGGTPFAPTYDEALSRVRTWLTGRAGAFTPTVRPQQLGYYFNASRTVMYLTYSAPSQTSLRFAVWGQQDGQNDLHWYQAKQQNGRWVAEVPLINHQETGTYMVHVYNQNGLPQGLLDHGTVVVDNLVQPEKPALKAALSADGRYLNLTLTGGSDLTRVWFPTWSQKNGQDDLQWYEAKKQADGSWTYSVALSRHNTTGTYFIHAYGNNKKNLVAHTTAYVEKIPGPEMKAALSADGRYLDVTLTGRSDLSQVWFPTWSQVNGQDDLRWHEAARQADGSWTCRIALSDHSGTGVYFIHAYGNTKKNLVAHTTVTVPQASQPEQPPQPVRSGMQAVLSADGRYLDVTLAGRSDLTKVWFPTWSAVNGQDDLRWYEATKQPDGSWTCRVPLANHKSAGGFFLHAYGNNKKNLVAHTTAYVEKIPGPEMKAALSADGRYLDVTLTGRSDLSQVWFPTWSQVNGQDDLRWHEAARQADGSWTCRIALSDHSGTGVYFIHAYGNTKKNLVAHTTVTVPQASQPEQPPQPVRSGMQAVLSADGRYLDVTLAGRSDLTKVWFPTWSAVNGQDDLRWYEATKQPDGSWTCRVPLANHKSAGGFFLHAYGNNKKNLVAHTTASVSQVVSPQVWTRLHDGGRYMTVTLTGRSDLTKVWFPTWGAANGQDDLQWYQAVRQSNGDWSYTVNLSQHRDKGTYFIHVYGNTRQNLVAHTTAYVS